MASLMAAKLAFIGATLNSYQMRRGVGEVEKVSLDCDRTKQ